MNEEILKWYISNIDEESFKTLYKRSSIRIQGFSGLKKKKIVPPRHMIINSLDYGKNLKVIKEYLSSNLSASINLNNKSENDLMDLFKERKGRKVIMEFVISSDEEEYADLKELIIEEIENNTLTLEEDDFFLDKEDENREEEVNGEHESNDEAEIEIATSNIKLDKENLIKLTTSLKEQNKTLNNEIKSLNNEKKSLNNDMKNLEREKNKQINILKEDNASLKKKLEASEKKEKKSIENYNSLKSKYDNLKTIEKELTEKNKDLIKESKKFQKKEEDLKNEKKDLQRELDNINKMLEKVTRDKIAIIGEIDSFHLKGSNYEFEQIDLDRVSNLDDLLKEYEEVWVLLYELSVLNQSKISRKENSYKVYKFKTFGELKEHMNTAR